MKGTEQSRKEFIAWVKKTNPKLYRAALVNSDGMSASMNDWFTKVTDSITNLAPKYLQFKQQKDVMKMQMKRANQGLPPAKVEDYAPVIKTRIDLAPETRAEIIKGGRDSLSDFGKPLIYGGLALAAFYFFTKK